MIRLGLHGPLCKRAQPVGETGLTTIMFGKMACQESLSQCAGKAADIGDREKKRGASRAGRAEN